MYNVRICHLFKPITQNQYSRHLTHSPWSCHIWRFPYYIKNPSLVQIGLQLFKWGHFHIFSLSYNLTSYDLWPWYVTFDLINKWGFPNCIYDPTLVEIHQSAMWKLGSNVNPFSQQQQQTTSTTTYNSGQSIPYVSFLLREATQKLSAEDKNVPPAKVEQILVF